MVKPLNLTLRAACVDDLPALTEIRNHYIVNTHITFDVEPYSTQQLLPWFHDHSGHNRYRMMVACDADTVLGYACTGRFRTKAAYDTTVEASIACRPEASGQGLGTLLYQKLFATLAAEDIHRIVAGIAQPNPASNALHQKLGFKPIGTFSEVGRKFGRYWDVIWMERPLKL